jgi:endoglucanase Acf2
MNIRILPLLAALTLALPLHAVELEEEPTAIPVGKGSFASSPPKSEEMEERDGVLTDSKKISKFLSGELFLDETARGKPLPTNDWWTNIIFERFGGNLWAYPFMVRGEQQGVRVFFPTEWNQDGNNMVEGPNLFFTGQTKESAGEWIVLAQFEGDSFPPGWQAEGEAWGAGPAPGVLPGQTPVDDYMGTGLASSIHNADMDGASDGTVGTLTSPPFPVERKFLHFLLGGGRSEEELRFEVLVDGQVVAFQTGEDSERLKWRTIDLSAQAGKSATIRMIDNATGGWGHMLADQILLSDSPTPPAATGTNFSAEARRALSWGDWTVTMRLRKDAQSRIDATIGRGLPYVWLEYDGVAPVVALPGGAELLTAAGEAAVLPLKSDALLVRADNRVFGLYAPEGSTFQKSGAGLLVSNDKGVPFLVAAALPDVKMAPAFGQYAYAVPRDSRFDWTYDPAKGEVATTWKLTTQALRGTNLDTVQGWLPHHWRTTRHNLDFKGPSYLTPRGKLRSAIGREFQIAWKFNGIPPMLPAPTQKPYERSQMQYYLDGYVEKTVQNPDEDGEKRYGADTYWGGKSLLQYGLYANMAALAGFPDQQKPLQATLRDALVDWLTYEPGELEHFFAWYPKEYSALVGFNPSYGSEEFTDNHFHYGYLTTAAALLGMLDPQFLADYGEAATLVAKQYANWDRADTRFPFLRTFDPWAGHSYAGGKSSVVGNNQESSSEAMQSWGGLFQLGALLKDEKMTAAGAMGWAIEESAVQEYWNDYYGWKIGAEAANFSPKYGKTIVGILGDSGGAFGTFFHGHPMFVYGIQWLPLSTSLYYLGRDPVFAKRQLDTMLAAQAVADPEFTFSKLGADWGAVTLGYQQFSDPDGALNRLAELWKSDDEIATSKNIAGLAYYFAAANRELGPVAWEAFTDVPTSLVYRRTPTSPYTVVAYNPGATPLKARLFRRDLKGLPAEAGAFTLPPGKLTVLPVAAK